jgi:hypothetical protein
MDRIEGFSILVRQLELRSLYVKKLCVKIRIFSHWRSDLKLEGSLDEVVSYTSGLYSS